MDVCLDEVFIVALGEVFEEGGAGEASGGLSCGGSGAALVEDLLDGHVADAGPVDFVPRGGCPIGAETVDLVKGGGWKIAGLSEKVGYVELHTSLAAENKGED